MWFSFDLFTEPNQLKLILDYAEIAGEVVHVLWGRDCHLEVGVPLVDEVKSLDGLNVEPLAGL